MGQKVKFTLNMDEQIRGGLGELWLPRTQEASAAQLPVEMIVLMDFFVK